MPLGREAGFGPGDIVLDGDPAPPGKGAQHPQHFSAHVYCGQNGRPSQLLLSYCVQITSTLHSQCVTHRSAVVEV